MSRSLFTVFALILTALLTACGGPMTIGLQGTQRATGTDGNVTITSSKAGIHTLTVKLAHIPPPSRISPGATAFVLWVFVDEAEPIRAGAMDVDADDRTARARITVPEDDFEIGVTAERERRVTGPSEHVVVRQRIRIQ